VRAFGNQQGIERAVCFECFANRVDSGEAVHFELCLHNVAPFRLGGRSRGWFQNARLKAGAT
jgi:hypothetical protein